MSKLYNSQTYGIAVLSGKVVSVSEDRKEMDVTYRDYDRQTKQATEKTKTVLIQNGSLDEGYKKGASVTVAGYIMGAKNMQAASISRGENVYETQEIAVVSGHVVKASYKDEKNEDGTPKLKQDGTPRKPHYDIEVVVPEDDHEVHHFVKVYDSPQFQKKGDPTNIEKYQNRFKNFKDPEETPTRVTIVTNPGQSYTFETDNGIYYGVSHLGIKSLDMDFEYSLKKAAEKAEVKEEAPKPEIKEEAAPKEATPEQAKSEYITEVDPEELEVEFE